MNFSENNTTAQIFDKSGHSNSTPVVGISHSLSMGYFITMSTISVLGTSGNILVLLSILLEKRLRTVANYLIGHLSLLDMVICAVILPTDLAIASGISSPPLCSLIANTFALLPNLSLQSQCLISINRYALVAQTTSVYRTWFSTKRTRFAVLAIWMINMVTLLVVCLFFSKPIPNYSDACSISDDPTGTRTINYYIVSLSCAFTFTISVIFYGKLIVFVRTNSMSLSAIKRADSRASMTLLVLLLMFVISLIISPLLLYLNNIFDLDSQGGLSEVALCVMYVNYCVNPILYGFKMRLFRQVYSRLLCFCLPEKRQIAPEQPNQSTRSTDTQEIQDRLDQ